MNDSQVTIDLTYAKNALFVRQSVAVAFGIHIDRELTWGFLKNSICGSEDLTMPKRVIIRGLPSDSGVLGEESQMLRGLLRAVRTVHNIEVQIVLHD